MGKRDTRDFFMFDVSDEGVSTGVAITILTILCLISLVGLSAAVYALWRICFVNSSELRAVDKRTVDTAISCIVLHAFIVTLDPIIYLLYATNQDAAANILWLIWDCLWAASKLNLYFIYIYRCFITFRHTKYAYSPCAVYVPLALSWCVQLLNMCIFILHDLDEGNRISDADNPLADDTVVVTVYALYMALDLLIILCVFFLFINPIIKLMADLRTKSVELLEFQSNTELAASTAEISTSTEPSSSAAESAEIKNFIAEEPHSPTNFKLLASRRNIAGVSGLSLARLPSSPSNITAATAQITDQSDVGADNGDNAGATAATPTATKLEKAENLKPIDDEVSMTSIDSKFKKMTRFGRLPCPEDEEAAERENLKPIDEGEKTSANRFKLKLAMFATDRAKEGKSRTAKAERRWNLKQMALLNLGTRLALLSVVSLSSGFLYQFLWILSVSQDTLGSFSYTWGLDTVCIILCIYLSFSFAEKEYNALCLRGCRCHKCCLKCVERMAENRIYADL